MALSQRLEIRQGQTLVMTPQLQQAIKLLQLSNVELGEYCEQELEKNPLLERVETAPSVEPEPAPVEAPEERLETSLAREDFSKCEEMDTSRDNLYDNDEPPAASVPSQPLADWTTVRSSRGFEGDEDALESTVAEGGSLKDYLLGQLAIAALDHDKRLICVALIDAIDEAGYLRADLGELAERLGAQLCDVEATLAELQGFDPVGVGARDLAECLALQLKDKDRFDPAMQTMLAHLDLVARRDTVGLAHLCGVDAADIADMIAEIRDLSPKPGPRLQQRAGAARGARRDRARGTGRRLAGRTQLGHAAAPPGQRALLRQGVGARPRQGIQDLSHRVPEQRQLAGEEPGPARPHHPQSVERDRAPAGRLLAYGVRHLRPLNLRTIADAIGMHESTVSRVTSNNMSPRRAACSN